MGQSSSCLIVYEVWRWLEHALLHYDVVAAVALAVEGIEVAHVEARIEAFVNACKASRWLTLIH
jgi:hypothetical protein